jgi:hypothetical protein
MGTLAEKWQRYHWAGEGKWLDIAEISGNAEAGQHVGELLTRHEIPWGGGGSKTFNLCVATEKESDAITLLRADADRHGYWVMFYRLDLAGEVYYPVAIVESNQVNRLAEVFERQGWLAFCGGCRDYTPVYATEDAATAVVHWLRVEYDDSGRHLVVL